MDKSSMDSPPIGSGGGSLVPEAIGARSGSKLRY